MTCCKNASHPNWSHCAWHTLIGNCSYPISIPGGLGGYGGFGSIVGTSGGGGGGGNPHGNELPELLSQAVEKLWENPSLPSMQELIVALGNEGWYDYALGATMHLKTNAQSMDEYSLAVDLESDLIKQVAEGYKVSSWKTIETLKVLPPQHSSEIWNQLRKSSSSTIDPDQVKDLLGQVSGQINTSNLASDIATNWNNQAALGQLLTGYSAAIK